MHRRALPLVALLAAPAGAATITGRDCNNQDLVCDGSAVCGTADTCSNGDTLSGTFTRVRRFEIGAAATIFVAPAVELVVYASTITVRGRLDGSGRGQPGGAGGAINAAGLAGSPGGAGGAGAGGAATKGAGGGAGAGNGGAGGGDSGGGLGAAGGAAYGAAVSSPLSANDLHQGSGGGGGGGDTANNGGTGAAGGAGIYLEASSITISGTITVAGSTAASVSEFPAGTKPGGGGGGGGGTLLIRALGGLSLSDGSVLSADGGRGGNVNSPSGAAIPPGGGGGGGRLRVFFRNPEFGAVAFSTAAGAAGFRDGGFSGANEAPAPVAGVAGAAAFGVIASSANNFTGSSAYVSSIAWTWNLVAAGDFGTGAGALYRIFSTTNTVPYSGHEHQTVDGLTNSATVQSLTPNTTYSRFVTAFTEWGDSLPSNIATMVTLASAPKAGAPAFTALSDTSFTAQWTAPTNPADTDYEVERSTRADFASAVWTGVIVALSSSPAGLSPNTTYYARARAVNRVGTRTDFTATMTTATLAATPTSPALGGVHITSIAFQWSLGGNPSDTVFEAEISSDNFFSLIASSRTLSLSTTFSNLTPGDLYFLRARAVGRAGTPSAYSTVISTRSGLLSDTSAPTAPGQPQPDRQFSYDGGVQFDWAAAASGVGILDYHLIVGSTPGGNDVLDTSLVVTSRSIAGLATGRSYYARVRARSNAGVFGSFSEISPGVPVFITAQVAAIPKPFNWPNPFNPAQGPTQIGFVLEAPGTVTLKIFSLTGQLVYEASQSFAGTGNQVMEWPGASNAGLRVSPGGYVVMVQKDYGGRVDTQKFKIAVLY